MRTLIGDELAQFQLALRARNLVPPSVVVADGGFHRCNTRSRNGKGDGSYVIFADGTIPAGSICNWQDGLGQESWCYRPQGRQRTAAEDAEATKKAEAARKLHDEQVAADHKRIAEKARRLWDAAPPAVSHPYLTLKKIKPCGVRTLYNGALLAIPLRDTEGSVHTLQLIDADGRKRFLKGGAVGGHFFTIPGHDHTVYVAEGFATAASINEATGCIAVAATNDKNLLPVAEAVRQKYPSAEIVLCADDDHKTKGNPGLRAARAAARAVNATVVAPEFGQNRRDKDTDFNDLATFIGPDAVKRSIAATMAPDECLVKQLEVDPFAALLDPIAKELADLKQRDRGTFAKLRLDLRKARVRSALLDEAIDEQEEGESEEQGAKQVDVLIGLAQNNNVELFYIDDFTTFAAITTADGHREIHAVKSTEFRRWLRNGYFDLKKSAPSSEAMTSGVATIDAIAARKGKCRNVFLRVAELDGKLYVDLCDSKWRAIEVGADGWRIVNEPRVLFRRKSGMLPLPTPAPEGSIDLLRPFLNLRNDDDFVLIVSYLLAALSPRSPYPVLAVAGAHGGAKSTLVELLRLLIDPNTTALRTLPREDRELFIQARNSHLQAFDNLSSLPSWISDALCRIADGSGYSVRSLFTDDDEVLFGGARPIVLNGIEDFVVRPDLADRTIAVTLEEVDEDRRRSKHELLQDFEGAQPLILGALLDAMVHGLRRLPGLRLGRLPRLADFATWATACETACFHDGAFMDAFTRNREEAIRTVLEADIVAQTVLRFMEIREEWEGTATDLLDRLAAIAGEAATRKKSWPGAANALSGRLRRAAPFLRKRSILVERRRSTDAHEGHIFFLSHARQSAGKDRPDRPSSFIPNKNKGLADDANAKDRRSDRPSSSIDRPQTSRDNPLKNKESSDGNGRWTMMDDVSLSSTKGEGKDNLDAFGNDQHRKPEGSSGSSIHVCAQCQASDGAVVRYECDSDDGCVWLHALCRPFWLKAQRSAWR